MLKKNLALIGFILIVSSVCLYAQQTHSFMYNEWPDGCLTIPSGRGHYDYSGRHRNDNAEVRNELDYFYNWVNQNNAIVKTNKSQEYSPATSTRAAEIYINIILIATSSGNSGVSGYSSNSSSGYSPSTTSSYNPVNSNFLQIGYNFAYDAPFGFTLGDTMFFDRTLIYISFNFGYKSDPGKIDLEWIWGFAISATKWLRIPIGIGGNHIGRDKEYISGSWYDSNVTPSSGNYYSTDSLADWEHAFVVEVGLQPVIKDRFYLSGTYRLKGFKKNGFSIGAGFIF